MYVWIPEKQAVMVGDNFYRSFANLYAIRGTKFRNPMEWVDSLDTVSYTHLTLPTKRIV